MVTLGIDIGSRTIKIVKLRENSIIDIDVQRNTFDQLTMFSEIVQNQQYDSITVTGYGRHQFREFFSCNIISEIKAFALGSRFYFPNCRTILDIGGQDTKVISLDVQGKIKKFEMNDKCAAGTGRFLEIMSDALGYSLSEFGYAASRAENIEKINQMCTVFAESEVISLLSRGAPKDHIAKGIHCSITERTFTMLQKINVTDDFVFAGGVAMNPAIRKLLAEKLKTKINIPENPQIIGAIGAAIYGSSI